MQYIYREGKRYISADVAAKRIGIIVENLWVSKIYRNIPKAKDHKRVFFLEEAIEEIVESRHVKHEVKVEMTLFAEWYIERYGSVQYAKEVIRRKNEYVNRVFSNGLLLPKYIVLTFVRLIDHIPAYLKWHEEVGGYLPEYLPDLYLAWMERKRRIDAAGGKVCDRNDDESDYGVGGPADDRGSGARTGSQQTANNQYTNGLKESA